jgi:hypothetical protein
MGVLDTLSGPFITKGDEPSPFFGKDGYGLLQHLLILSWPLPLVLVGRSLSRDAFPENVNTPQKKIVGLLIKD